MALFGIFGKGKKKRRGVELSKSGSGKPTSAKEETSKLAKAAAVRLEAGAADNVGQDGEGKTKLWRRQIPLGQLLIRKGLISDTQLEEALAVQKERRKSSPTGAITESYLGRILIDMEFIAEAELAKFLSVYWQIPFVELSTVTIRKDVVSLLSGDVARKYCVFPLHKVGRTVVLAMFNPTAQGLMEYISKKIGFQIKPAIGTRSDILQFTDKFYPMGDEDAAAKETRVLAAVSSEESESAPGDDETKTRIVPADSDASVEEEKSVPVKEEKPAPVVQRLKAIQRAESTADASDEEPLPVSDVGEISEALDEVEPIEEPLPVVSSEEASAAPAQEEPPDVVDEKALSALKEGLLAKKGAIPVVQEEELEQVEEEEVIPVVEEEPEPVGAAEALAMLDQEGKSAPVTKAEPGPSRPVLEKSKAVLPTAKPAPEPKPAAAPSPDEGIVIAAKKITEEEFRIGLGIPIDEQLTEWVGKRTPAEQKARKIDSLLFDLSTGTRI